MGSLSSNMCKVLGQLIHVFLQSLVEHVIRSSERRTNLHSALSRTISLDIVT